MHIAPLLLPAVTAVGLTDRNITAAIETLFFAKKGMALQLIAVATQQGMVTLSGFTQDLQMQELAQEMVLDVRGVRGVCSTLQVLPSGIPDMELQYDLVSALADDPATTDYQLNLTVSQGVASLRGTVQSWAEKQLVLQVVKGVRGVQQCVADDLVIAWGRAHNSDAEITTEIWKMLAWDIRVNGALVDASTRRQVVHLSGTVRTVAEKERLVAIAYHAGASRVEARDLLVAGAALRQGKRLDKYSLKTDDAIASAVRDMFRLNPRLRAGQPVVYVRDGVVTLAGTVSNLRAKLDAEADAQNVVGVARVHDFLKVCPDRPVSDQDVAHAVAAALTRSTYVGHLALRVQVVAGAVLLTGRVATAFEQQQARKVAAAVSGVVAVNTQLELAVPEMVAAPMPTLPHEQEPLASLADQDQALAERIRARYRWSAALHDQELAVAVAKGRATLTGTVGTWLVRKQAARAAYEAGAWDVNNHVRTLAAF